LHLGLLDLEDAKVAELDADLGVGLDHEIAERSHYGADPGLGLVDRLTLEVRDAAGHVVLRKGWDAPLCFLGGHLECGGCFKWRHIWRRCEPQRAFGPKSLLV